MKVLVKSFYKGKSLIYLKELLTRGKGGFHAVIATAVGESPRGLNSSWLPQAGGLSEVGVYHGKAPRARKSVGWSMYLADRCSFTGAHPEGKHLLGVYDREP